MKNNNYCIKRVDTIETALKKMDLNQVGTVFIEEKKKIIGIATDGDIRRALLKKFKLSSDISKIFNKKFIYLLENDATRENILKILDTKIKIIPILSKNHKLISIVTKNNIDWNEKEKLISKGKAPVRISFAGGGTDLTNYFYKESGVVLNATINKFVNAVVEKRNDATIYIKSYDLDKEATYKGVDDIEFDGSLDLIKSVIKILKPEFGFNLFTYSDIPSGSGLGGSAALLSSVIGAFNNFRENKYTDYEISELSFHAERVALNLSGGWQDQYATVFGGFNYIEFKDNENIVNTLRISDEISNELEDSLILCYSGIRHDSNEIHEDQKKKMNNKLQKLYASNSKKIAEEMKSRLLKGRLDDFGELLGQAWETKKKFSSKITTPKLDKIYNFAIKNGALGGKLLGAGNGGYFLFYVPTFSKLKLMSMLKEQGYLVESFTFNNTGLRAWVTKKKYED